jgi:hypothetical protein
MKGSTSCLLLSWEKNSGEVLPVGSQQTISTESERRSPYTSDTCFFARTSALMRFCNNHGVIHPEPGRR